MAEEVKEAPQTEEKVESTSEKVENSEETQSQETKPVTQVVPEEKEETPKEEEAPVEEKKSVLDELLEAGKEKSEEKTEAKPEETESKVDKSGVDGYEKEIARAAFPKMDPDSIEWDPPFEEKVVKEYLYRWALSGGTSGPTLRAVAAQVSKDESAGNKPEPTAEKAAATAKPSTVTGPEAERTITSDEERKLMEGVKYNNQEAIKELLRKRMTKSE